MRTYRVADWLSILPIFVRPTASLADAQRIMEHRKMRRLPVVQDDRLAGIVTWGDVRAAQLSAATTLSVHEWRALLANVTVAECMTRDPVTIAPDAGVLDGARVVGVITESDLFPLLLADATGAEDRDRERATLACHHCGAVLRGRSFEGPDDECWHCHYHLHRCENCRSFDRIARHEPVSGQHCEAFAYLPQRAASPHHVDPNDTCMATNDAHRTNHTAHRDC